MSIRRSKSLRASRASARGTEVASCCWRVDISSRAFAVSFCDALSCSSSSSTVTLRAEMVEEGKRRGWKEINVLEGTVVVCYRGHGLELFSLKTSIIGMLDIYCLFTRV